MYICIYLTETGTGKPDYNQAYITCLVCTMCVHIYVYVYVYMHIYYVVVCFYFLRMISEFIRSHNLDI